MASLFAVPPPPPANESPLARRSNAVDRFLPQFVGNKSPKTSCNCGNAQTGCDAGVRASGGGQPCLWFSQGCTIGCDTCTGIGSHTNVSLCDSPKNGGKATLPKEAWTMNRKVAEGSKDDYYQHNPWRSPGAAPTNDACGMAGGTVPAHAGPGDAVYADNIFAKMGDLGSEVLKPAPSGTVCESSVRLCRWLCRWLCRGSDGRPLLRTGTAGTDVEVAWGIRFNQ